MCTLKTKTLMKQIEEDINNGKIFHAHGLGKKKNGTVEISMLPKVVYRFNVIKMLIRTSHRNRINNPKICMEPHT